MNGVLVPAASFAFAVVCVRTLPSRTDVALGSSCSVLALSAGQRARVIARAKFTSRIGAAAETRRGVHNSRRDAILAHAHRRVLPITARIASGVVGIGAFPRAASQALRSLWIDNRENGTLDALNTISGGTGTRAVDTPRPVRGRLFARRARLARGVRGIGNSSGSSKVRLL